MGLQGRLTSAILFSLAISSSLAVFFAVVLVSSSSCFPSSRTESPSAATAGAGSRAPADLDAHPSVRRFVNQSGLNLPWISYGHDVGWPRLVASTKLFGFRFYPHLIARRASMPSSMRTLRVWMLADDRAGNLAGLDPGEFTIRCVRDLSAFMDATAPTTRVMWVLYDFMLADGVGSRVGGRAGEHRRLVTTEAGADKALDLVLPCVFAIQAKYGKRIIWDVFNEPLNGRCLTVTDENQRGLVRFVTKHMEAILKMGGRVSLGARNLQALRETWAGLWRRLADFARRNHLPPTRLVVQFHHYPGQELDPSSSLRTFHAERLRKHLHLHRDTPILLGESWPASGFTLADYAARGFCGALFWQDARLPLDADQVHRQIADLLRWGSGRITAGLGDLPSRKPGPVALKSQIRMSCPSPSCPRPSSPKTSRTTSVGGRGLLSLDLSSCRIVDGPPSTDWWRRLIGARAAAFIDLAVRAEGALEISVEARARPPSRTLFWWTEHSRTGFLLCDLPFRAEGWDLTGRQVEVSVTPPDPRLCGKAGCGMQVVLADQAGRTLHGPWSGLWAAKPGRHRLRFRPAPSAVPGIGFRQAGFDLHHVQSVGLLWSAATFSSCSFHAKLKVHRIQVRTLSKQCKKTTVEPSVPTGSLLQPSHSPWCDACYRTVDTPKARVVRPGLDALKLSCSMKPSDYPYFQGFARDSSRGRLALHLDTTSTFARRAATWSDLVQDCRIQGSGQDIFGALVDIRSRRLTLRVRGNFHYAGSPGNVAPPMQVVLRDDRGKTCYVSGQWTNQSITSESLVLSLHTDHPVLCAAGSVDLSRVARLGLAFGPVRHKLQGLLDGLQLTITPRNLYEGPRPSASR